MYDNSTEEFTDEALYTRAEFVALMINFQDIALNLLSKQRKLGRKIIHDQAEFVEKMHSLLENNDSVFSLEHIQSLLPQNEWYPLYFEMMPRLETFVLNDPSRGIYNA